MGIIQGLIFVVIVLSTKKYYSNTNRFIAYTVLCMAMSNLQYWFIDTNIVNQFEFLGFIRIPCEFLMIPMFYRFVNHYLNKKISCKSNLILVIPFIFDFIFQLFLTINNTFFESKLLSYNLIYPFLIIEEVSSFCFSLFLIILTLKIVKKYENQNLIYNSTIVVAKTKWLKQILFIGLIVCVLWIVQIYYMKDNKGTSVYYPLWISISFIIYWLSYVGLIQSSILTERKSIREELFDLDKKNEINLKPKKIFESIQNERILTDYINIIEKNFSNPNLTLNSVASELEISSNYLSQIINANEISFNDYLNSIRIEKVKFMLKENNFNQYTITSIGLEAGFNSNASFYRAFKKVTGTSPSKYRN